MSDDHRGQPLLRTLQEAVAVSSELVSDRLELLALELHRAGRSLVQITALVLIAGILCATAWLALCSGLGLILVAQGVSLPSAMLAVIVVNLALTWAAVSRVRRLLANLGLPATRRHLVFGATLAGVAPDRQPSTRSPEGQP